MTQLSSDRALAMRTLMPRAYEARTTTPAELYRTLTRSGRAEVDRLVEAFREVRAQTIADLQAGHQ